VVLDWDSETVTGKGEGRGQFLAGALAGSRFLASLGMERQKGKGKSGFPSGMTERKATAKAKAKANSLRE
jgi:hypothetical protein